MRRLQSERYKILSDFIDDYYTRHMSGPSFREIAAGTGIPLSSVGRYLAEMKENGQVELEGHRQVRTRRMESRMSGVKHVPVMQGARLVGSVSCGQPKLAEENIDHYIPLSEELFGNGELFILAANGDSMTGAGIDSGDYVVVRRQNTAEDGEIVVALLNDSEEATLKRFYRDEKNQCFRLHPENPALEDIVVKECYIQGVAVRVIKNLC